MESQNLALTNPSLNTKDSMFNEPLKEISMSVIKSGYESLHSSRIDQNVELARLIDQRKIRYDTSLPYVAMLMLMFSVIVFVMYLMTETFDYKRYV